MFIAYYKTCNARQLAELYLDKVFLLFVTPDKIIFDQGTVFISQF